MSLHDKKKVNFDKTLLILIILMSFEGLFFFYYGISRHYNYLTSINDLGHIDRAIWETLKGTPFLHTDGHFDPIFITFVPFYLLAPSVVWLIFAQSVAIPLTGLPIYFLAKRVCKSEKTAFFWAVACILSPFMLSAASWDFHGVSLAVPFIALAFLAVEKRQPKILLLACLFILLCKEHFGLLVINFGLLWYMRQRSWKTSLSLILLGFGYFFLVMKIIIPAISPTGEHVMFTSDLGSTSRYAWLGHSFGEIAMTILTNPIEVFRQAFIDMGGMAYFILLLLPLLCLPLLGCEFVLPGIADLLANLLSANPMPRSIFAYHSATLIPVLITAAIYGSRRAGRMSKIAVPERQAFAALVITLVLGWVTFPFFSLPGSYGFWEPKRVISFSDPNYATVRNLITPNMSVSVQANIGPHFTQRHEVYMYPQKVGVVDAVILHLDSPTLFTKGRNPHEIGSLGHHLQMDPLVYLDSIQKLLHSDVYQKIEWKDPWLILMRGEKKSINVGDLNDKINKLYLEWQTPK